jgi:hypothetical protein
MFIIGMFKFNQIISQSEIISLNGNVDFEQTDNAFPPTQFTRKCPVPGLITSAEPKIIDFEKYFSGTQPSKYNWYRFKFKLATKKINEFAVLKLLKSMYNTQIFLNGKDIGTYMQCNTPIEVNLTGNLRAENELLIRTGDRKMLPKESAMGFDREKFTDIPGIWDNVNIFFSGPIYIKDILALPDIKNKRLKVKLRTENLTEIYERNMEYSQISYKIKSSIIDNTGNIVSVIDNLFDTLKSRSIGIVEFNIDIPSMKLWSVNDPYIYQLKVELVPNDIIFNNYGNPESIKPPLPDDFAKMTSEKISNFGMREFKSVDSHFEMNGERISLFGSTITLNRFLEDKDCKELPWNKDWVEKLLVTIPKALKWNHFRVSLGLLPEFWYDLADKNGILIQNEYPMWNLRGSDEQYEKEYTDWIWSQGNHPSIVIWDALNEQESEYLGNKLIPELKKLDNTRLWDAGWTKLDNKDIDEIHWYPLAYGWWWTDSMSMAHRNKFQFGKLFEKYFGMELFENSKAPIVANEYAWVWLNRDGKDSGIRTRGKFIPSDNLPSKINYEYFDPWGKQLYENRDVFDYYVGKNATTDDKRRFQSYIIAMEGEILRSTRRIAGLASFAYLTNDRGYTGDWFAPDIEKLIPTNTLLAQYHSHKPFAAFLDIKDGRYLKLKEYFETGKEYPITVFIVNDSNQLKSGNLKINILDDKGKRVSTESIEVKLTSNWQKLINFVIKMPEISGGYMIMTELADNNDSNIPQVSLRYINVGKREDHKFYNYSYEYPIGFPK